MSTIYLYACTSTIIQHAHLQLTHTIKTSETRVIKCFPAKTFTNVGMVQWVIKNQVRSHHPGKISPDTRRRSLASLPVHKPCTSQFVAFKRLCIHCTQVNILRLQDTLNPLSPSLHLATSFYATYASHTIVIDIKCCDLHSHTIWYSTP